MQRNISNITRQATEKFKSRSLFKKIAWAILGFGLIASMQVFAQQGTPDPLDSVDDNDSIQRVEEIKATKGKGWQLSTKGGLKYVNPDDERYWFAISGVIRLDQVFYSGSQINKQGQFPNSAFIRRIEPGMDGGIGKDWEYTVNFQFCTLTNPRSVDGLLARLQDTWVGYTGFSKNSELFLGRVSGNWFGLDGSTGSTWMPFMERSAQANAFYPGDGLGVMGDIWWEDSAITAVVIQPDQGDRLAVGSGSVHPFRSDRIRAIVRATYAPRHCLGDVWHFGVSGAYLRFDSIIWDRIVRSSVGGIPPAGVAQRNPVRILTAGPFPMTYSHQWNVEAARQIGPFIAEAEYTHYFAHRVGDPLASLRFRGWNLQTRYILTGEAHTYDVRDGSFGSIDICSPYGALEAALRYDYLNLNDKNIHGGSQHNVTFGLNWFLSANVRLTGNYIYSDFRPAAPILATTLAPNQAVHRKLNVFALRLQIKFK